MKLPKRIEIVTGYDAREDQFFACVTVDGNSFVAKSAYSELTIEELCYKLCHLVKTAPELKS